MNSEKPADGPKKGDKSAVPGFREILPLLLSRNVPFILIGGGAALAHGLARATYDVDVVYSRDPASIRNLADALQPYQPYLRGAARITLPLGRAHHCRRSELYPDHPSGGPKDLEAIAELQALLEERRRQTGLA